MAEEWIGAAAPVAVGVAIQEMKNEDAAIRLRAAFGILDRAGVETATKQQVEQQVVAPELMAALERWATHTGKTPTRID